MNWKKNKLYLAPAELFRFVPISVFLCKHLLYFNLFCSFSVFLHHPSSDPFSSERYHPPDHSPHQVLLANQVERLRPNSPALVCSQLWKKLFQYNVIDNWLVVIGLTKIAVLQKLHCMMRVNCSLGSNNIKPGIFGDWWVPRPMHIWLSCWHWLPEKHWVVISWWLDNG